LGKGVGSASNPETHRKERKFRRGVCAKRGKKRGGGRPVLHVEEPGRSPFSREGILEKGAGENVFCIPEPTKRKSKGRKEKINGDRI